MSGSIEKVAIVKDNKGGTVLMGVARKGEDSVNFKAAFDWDTLDHAGFAKDLRERLAQDLDVAFSEMDINESALFRKMKADSEWLRG
jgi:hypothetical protein